MSRMLETSSFDRRPLRLGQSRYERDIVMLQNAQRYGNDDLKGLIVIGWFFSKSWPLYCLTGFKWGGGGFIRVQCRPHAPECRRRARAGHGFTSVRPTVPTPPPESNQAYMSPNDNSWSWFSQEYTLSHRECGQFRHCLHENFEKFEMISTPTGSWIRSRRRPHQLPVGVEIISNFFKIFMNIGTELSTLSMGHSIGILISLLLENRRPGQGVCCSWRMSTSHIKTTQTSR